tara:strand:- start:617 stop:856 length:240 start_codon:yes stop_codon:yes gene_type:complete
MSDFKKGLLVGMLIIIGCGVFVANSSDDDNGRYEFHLLKLGNSVPMLLDNKTGDLYTFDKEVPNVWKKWKSINNNTKSK